MGTDIHGVFQRHDNDGWHDVPSEYDFGRHYQLFAVLADVRNGYGFAGVQTGEPVKPIALPRGYPEGFAVDEGSDSHTISALEIMAPWRREYHQADEPLEIWMGDHSHNWLTSEEMLDWYAKAPTVVKRGVLDKAEYEAWDKTSTPDSYCGGIDGPRIVVINEVAVTHTTTPWTHVDCTWESPLFEELGYFFDEVKRLHELHGGVRFVFGFDS